MLNHVSTVMIVKLIATHDCNRHAQCEQPVAFPFAQEGLYVACRTCVAFSPFSATIIMVAQANPNYSH